MKPVAVPGPVAVAVVVAVAVTLGLVSIASSASASSRALTALDDARACTPLSRGGYAVATGGGLAIVDKDGGLVKSMTSLDGLPDTRVHSVVESADGLWVGTEGGAALINLTTAAPVSVARTVGDESVHAIVTTASNGIFLGTWGRGVFRLADKSSAPVLVPTTGGTVGKHVAAISEHAGAVHVAYSDGPVTRFESGALRVVNGTPTHGQAIGSFGTRLVFADIEGLFRVNEDSSLLSLSTVDARGLASADRLYVATYGSGLLASTSPTGTALRAESGVPRWVKGVGVKGTSRCAATTEGLFVSEGAAPWHKVPLGQGPMSNDVTTLAVNDDKQRVLIGTFDRGASVSINGSSFQKVQGLEPTETVNASVWQGNTLWLGTAHGLVRVDGATLSATHRVRAADGLPSSIVRAVLVLSKDRLLVGTEEGAALIDVAHNDRPTPLVAATKKKGTRETLASPMHATWSLAQGSDGTIYLGTASGLYWGKVGDETFERASLASSDLKDDWVTALAIQGNTLYAGTYSGGVSKITFESGTGNKHTSTHLGGGYVNPAGLMIAGNELYASTMDSLLVRALSDSDTTKWQTRSNAATGKDVTSARFAGSSLWVSSRRGITIVSP